MKWNSIPLGEICNIEIGKTPSRKKIEYWGPGKPFLSISDMNQGRYFTSTTETITDQGIAECKCRLVPTGTLILSFKLSIGKVGFTKTPMYTNEAIAALYIKNPSLVINDYLYWALQYIDLLQYVDSAAKGKTLNKKKLEIINTPLPPLEEQKRIAAILDKADELRRKRRQAIQRLDDLLQSVFLDMFGDPITNPKDWKMCNIGSLCNLVRGSSPRPKSDPRYYGGPVPRVMVADLTRDGYFVTPKIDSLTIEGAKKSRPIKKDTVIMAVSGNVGLTSILSIDACIHDGFIAFTNLKTEYLKPIYFLFCMNSLKQTHEKRKDGAIFQNTTTIAIKNMSIPIPKIEIQNNWCSYFDQILSEKKILTNSVLSFDNLFHSLQQRAFRGDLSGAQSDLDQLTELTPHP